MKREKTESPANIVTRHANHAAHLAWVLATLLLALNVAGLWLIFISRDSVDVWTLVYPGAATIALVYPLVGAFVAAHRPHNPVGWLMILMGASEAVTLFAQGYAAYSVASYPMPSTLTGLLSWVAAWIWVAGFIILPLLLLYFPDGHLPGRRWRWVLPAVASASGLMVGRAVTLWPQRRSILVLNGSALDAAVDAVGGFWGLVMDFSAFMLFVAYTASILSLVARYRQTGATGRLQIKWFAFAGSAAVLVQIASVVLIPYGGYLGGSLRQIFFAALQAAGFAGIALAIGIAILRYRLYDIDVVIRKTLVYSVLTGLLALVYFSSVILLQQLFATFTRQDSTAAVVASTLLIAALFTPLRRRVQHIIDKRFFRRKYDAQQVLARFANIARNEVGLEPLTAQLLHVIEETMQPAGVGIWLRENQEQSKQ